MGLNEVPFTDHSSIKFQVLRDRIDRALHGENPLWSSSAAVGNNQHSVGKEGSKFDTV